MGINKILVADDSVTDRKNMEEILSNGGYRVILAESGAEAIEKSVAESPDVIFLDVVMDEKNGFQTCRELKKSDATKEIPVYLVSSKSQKVDKLYASQVGAKELLSKPVSEQAIMDIVKNL